MPSIPTTPEEHRRFAKNHAPRKLHPIIDAVYEFAEKNGCQFYNRSPADYLGLGAKWENADGISRNISVAVYYATSLEAIRVYVAAWRDDLTIRKRLHRGYETRRLQAPIDPTQLIETLEASYEEARSLAENDLVPTTDLRWVT